MGLSRQEYWGGLPFPSPEERGPQREGPSRRFEFKWDKGRFGGKDLSHGLMPRVVSSSFQSGGSQVRNWSLKD